MQVDIETSSTIEPEDVPMTPRGTHIDIDAYIAGMGNHSVFQAYQNALHSNNLAQHSPAEYKQMFEGSNPQVYLNQPAPDDLTIQYAVIKPRFNFPALHIRFWFAQLLGFSFNLIEPTTKAAIYAPTDLAIKMFQGGQWKELMAVTEAIRKCLSHGPPSVQVPPMWNAEPGSLIRFSIGSNGPILGEVLVPVAPITEVPQYQCFPTLDEAIASFPLDSI